MSGASCKLTVQHILGDLAMLHVADMTKPVHLWLRKANMLGIPT